MKVRGWKLIGLAATMKIKRKRTVEAPRVTGTKCPRCGYSFVNASHKVWVVKKTCPKDGNQCICCSQCWAAHCKPVGSTLRLISEPSNRGPL